MSTRFVRDLVSALEHGDASVRARITTQVPRRIDAILAQVQSPHLGVDETIPLYQAEELLLTLDSLLGDGSGRVLESAGFVQGSRILSPRGDILIPGDLRGTLQRLEDAFTFPHKNICVSYRVVETEMGFELSLSVPGAPRYTRALRHLLVGYIKAAYAFGMDRNPNELRLYAHVIGEEASISVRTKTLGGSQPKQPISPHQEITRRLPLRRISSPGTLSAEVERIFEGTPLASTPPPSEPRSSAGRSSSSFRALRPSGAFPTVERRSEPPEPEQKPNTTYSYTKTSVEGPVHTRTTETNPRGKIQTESEPPRESSLRFTREGESGGYRSQTTRRIRR